MKNIAFLGLATFTFITALNSSASEVESSTGLGTGTFSQGFTYHGDASEKSAKKSAAKDPSPTEKDSTALAPGWNWNLGYTYTATILGATSTLASGTGAKDNTHAMTAGIGVSEIWEAGVDFEYSNTKEENLHNFGFNPYVGYTFDLKESDDFVPTLNFRLTGGFDRYTQESISTTRVGSRRTITVASAPQTIQQSKVEFDAMLSALEWFDFKLVYTKYSYDKDVATFLARLDEPRAIVTGAANFGSTLNGFSSNEGTAQATFHLPNDTDLEAGFTQASAVMNSSRTRTYELNASKVWNDQWKVGAGFQRSVSDTDLQSLTTLTVAYDF